MKIYRIEHVKTKLGPFTHGNQIAEVINKGLKGSAKFIEDIDHIPEVQSILKEFPNAIFGFISENKCKEFIRDPKVLEKHGFVLAEYDATPLYLSIDEQVIYAFSRLSSSLNDCKLLID